jgi:hypothetical protein
MSEAEAREALLRTIQIQKRRVLGNPESRAALLIDYETTARRDMRDLSSWIHMNDATRKQLITMLAQQRVQLDELALGVGETMVEGRRVDEADLRSLHRQQIGQLLGYELMQQWEDYQAMGFARAKARELGRQLHSAGARLNKEQALQMAEVFARTEPRRPDPFTPPNSQTGSVSLEERVQRIERNNLVIRRAAAQVISSQQLPALEHMLENELRGFEMAAALRGHRPPATALPPDQPY